LNTSETIWDKNEVVLETLREHIRNRHETQNHPFPKKKTKPLLSPPPPLLIGSIEFLYPK
jgi:hypothetical protein